MLTMDAINMADPLEPAAVLIPGGSGGLMVYNGADIRVTRNAGASPELFIGTLPTAQRIVLNIPLNINSMTAAELELVPGIGSVLAERIVRYRQINGGRMEVKDLLAIEGIGDKKYIRLNKYFNKQ